MQQPIHSTLLLQGVKVGALQTNRHGVTNASSKPAARAQNAPVSVKVGALQTNRHGVRNASSKPAARAQNAPVRMLARRQEIVVKRVFSS